MPYRISAASNDTEPSPPFSLLCWLGHHAWGPENHIEIDVPTGDLEMCVFTRALRPALVRVKRGYFLLCERCGEKEFHDSPAMSYVGVYRYNPGYVRVINHLQHLSNKS